MARRVSGASANGVRRRAGVGRDCQGCREVTAGRGMEDLVSGTEEEDGARAERR